MIEIELSNSDVSRIAEAIVPTVYQIKCPFCIVLPGNKCKDFLGSGRNSYTRERQQPHMERIRKAVVIFMSGYLRKKD